MERLNIQFNVNKKLYKKNPDTSELGRKIITHSIELINELGFEKFTFKKLSLKIDSPESSIYRYFENKHTLLIYLTSWYWSWIAYKIVLNTTNVKSSEKKLIKSLHILTEPIAEDKSISYVNEVLLNKIIITESAKAYHTKDVDEENKKGYFEAYKSVINRVAEFVLEINPTFKFSHMLISTVVEGSHQQKYFAEHIPSLTDSNNKENYITKFYTDLVFNFLKK